MMDIQEMRPVTALTVRGVGKPPLAAGRFILVGMKARCPNCGDPDCVNGHYVPLRAWSFD